MLTLNDLTPGKLAVDGQGKLAVILEHKLNYPKNPVIYTAKAGGTKYKAPASWFKAIVGDVDLAAFNESAGDVPASRSNTTDSDPFMPEKLKGIKIGEQIQIHSRRGVETVTYQGYNRRRPKYPVTFTNSKGRSMKGGLSIVIGKTATA